MLPFSLALPLPLSSTPPTAPQVGVTNADPLSQGLGFSSLRITSVLADNDGVYQCTAQNSFGAIYKDIRIIVEGKLHHLYILPLLCQLFAVLQTCLTPVAPM